MNKFPLVCILSAGRGLRMGSQYSNINKALLPLGDKAIISHIIDDFPLETNFVIALGHLAGQVREYLEMAHPNNTFIFVNVDNYDSKGSGPGYSLWCCREYLNQEFYFVACDTIFKMEKNNIPDGNWAGVAKIPVEESTSYCNFKVQDDQVVEIHDKEKCDDQSRAFTGFLYVHDHEFFWNGLSSVETIAGERQISNGLNNLLEGPGIKTIEGNWIDVGTEERYRLAVEKYHDYDFGKTNEHLYFVGQHVIKFFSDSSIVKNRIAKALLNPAVFPKIERASEQFYSYKHMPGETLYTYNNPTMFTHFIAWLDAEVWNRVDVEQKYMQKLCEKFYFDKTMGRLNDFNNKYPEYDCPTRVNGEPVLDMNILLEKIDWRKLSQGIPVFMHGDLQFDNVLFDPEQNEFVLLDWRQDFSGEVAFGDLYYDIAKLNGGFLLNYDYIKKGLFTVERVGTDIYIDFARRNNCLIYEKILEKFIFDKGLELERVHLLTALIFLNMAPLHHPPFDVALYSLANQMLSRLINIDEEQ